MLQKYSRFHGKSEFSIWCNSPNLKNTDGFRDIVYQLSPYNIACVYKKMFERYSSYNLRILDDEGISDTESDASCFTKENCSPTDGLVSVSVGRQRSSSEPVTPRSQHEYVDKSNSCVYSVPHSNVTCKPKCQPNKAKYVSGWRICERPHSPSVTGYQAIITEETKDVLRKQGKSTGHREPNSKTFKNSLLNARVGYTHHSGICVNDHVSSGCGKKSVREGGDDTGLQVRSSSMMSLRAASPIKVGRRFKHFRRSHSYIDQYREEYTYRKLQDVSSTDVHEPPRPTTTDGMLCSCGNSTCCGSLINARSIQRWYPTQSHALTPQNITACEKTSDNITSGAPVPKRTAVPKKRPPQSQTKYTRMPLRIYGAKFDEAQKKGMNNSKENSSGSHKIEFASSFTVNNYNPVIQSSAIQRSASASPSPVVLSGSYGSVAACIQHGPICSPAPQVRCQRRQMNHKVRGTN